MKNNDRKIRQEKLARLFYEMGMDLEIVSKVSGISVDKITKMNQKRKKLIDWQFITYILSC